MTVDWSCLALKSAIVRDISLSAELFRNLGVTEPYPLGAAAASAGRLHEMRFEFVAVSRELGGVQAGPLGEVDFVLPMLGPFLEQRRERGADLVRDNYVWVESGFVVGDGSGGCFCWHGRPTSEGRKTGLNWCSGPVSECSGSERCVQARESLLQQQNDEDP